MRGYETLVSNCKKGKEGLIFAAKEGTFISMEKLSESNENNYLTVRVVYPECCIRFIITHGPQETEEVGLREEFYETMMIEIERGKSTGDMIVIIGDINAKIDKGGDDTITERSPNGTLLKEVIEKYELKVINFHQNTVGKWTRIQKTKNSEQKSVLDYILVKEDIAEKVERLIIDEDKLYTPWRVVTRKGKKEIVFTDHAAMIMSMDVLTGSKREEGKGAKKWVITDAGLTHYSKCSKKEILINKGDSSTAQFQCWVDEVENLMNKCFAKKSVNKKQGIKWDRNKGVSAIKEILYQVIKKVRYKEK